MAAPDTDLDEKTVDIQITDHGSVMLFSPRTARAREWIDQNVADDAQFFGIALVVEPRYAENLIGGMCSDGLEVR